MIDFPTTYFGEVRKVGKTTPSLIPTTTPYGVWWGESSPSAVERVRSVKKQAEKPYSAGSLILSVERAAGGRT